MNILGNLPAWAIVLLGLGSGATLLYVNYGWLLAVKAMLEGHRRKGGSTTDATAGDRADPTGSSAR